MTTAVQRPGGRPLRVAMLTTFYPPYAFGGDGVGVQRLSRALARRGHHVTVLHDVDAYRALSAGPDPDATPETTDGLEVIPLSSALGPISTLLTQQTGRPVVKGRRIARILDRGDFDVIHYNNVSLLGGPGVLSLGDGIKIYEAHEHWLVCPTHVLWRHNREVCAGRECLRCVLSYRRPPQLWRRTGLLERQLAEVDVLIAKSEFSRGKHREFGLDRDMEVLPYFLPDADQPPDPATQSPHPRPYFLFVGRLEKIKGLEDVLPVFREFTGADLLIAGDGTYERELRTQAEGNPRVHFLGRLRPEELSRYYASAISLIVPSICFETFGIILIEAFRNGTPVVARRIGPFPEIVEACGGGELFDDADDLALKLGRLAGNPERRAALAKGAFDGFQRLWSESAVVPGYLEIIARAALESGRPDIASVAAPPEASGHRGWDSATKRERAVNS